MRTKIFEVGGEMIAPFFGFLDSTMLQVQMLEINDEQEIVTEVGYTDDDKEAMMDLIELYDEHIEARKHAEALEAEDDDEEEEDDLGCLEQEEEEEEKPKRRTNRKVNRRK